MERAELRLVVELRAVRRNAIRRLDEGDVAACDQPVLVHKDLDFVGVQHRVAELELDIPEQLAMILANLALRLRDDVVDAGNLFLPGDLLSGGLAYVCRDNTREQQNCQGELQHR